MNKKTFKTLSLSLLTVAMAAASSSAAPSSNDQKAVLEMAAGAVASDALACSAQQAIDRGWEYQRGLLEGRLEAKASNVLEVKGAIISPPFPGFPPVRETPAAPAAPTTGNRAPVEHLPSH